MTESEQLKVAGILHTSSEVTGSVATKLAKHHIENINITDLQSALDAISKNLNTALGLVLK